MNQTSTLARVDYWTNEFTMEDDLTLRHFNLYALCITILELV